MRELVLVQEEGLPLSGKSRRSRQYVQQLSTVEIPGLSNFHHLPRFLDCFVSVTVGAMIDFLSHLGERTCLVFFGHHQFHWVAALCAVDDSCRLYHLFVSQVNSAIIAPSPSVRPLMNATMVVTACFILFAPCLLVGLLICFVKKRQAMTENGIKVVFVAPLLQLRAVLIVTTDEIGLHMPMNECANEQEIVS